VEKQTEPKQAEPSRTRQW